MFKILVSGGRKPRRSWSAGTVAVSLAAHGALFALVGYAAVGTANPPAPEEPPIIWTDFDPPLPPVEPQIEPSQPQAPQPAEADEPAPVVGESLVLEPPPEVPTTIPLPTVEPVTDPTTYNGDGPAGDILGVPNPADTRAPTGNTDPGDVIRPGDVVEAGVLAEAPAVQNTREAQRALERLYPTVLRDAGVSGEATLQFIVGTDGRVEPASIRVVSATHDQFGEASRRAVERFRFRPAKVNGTPVRVLISLPINWVAPE